MVAPLVVEIKINQLTNVLSSVVFLSIIFSNRKSFFLLEQFLDKGIYSLNNSLYLKARDRLKILELYLPPNFKKVHKYKPLSK